jgi:hypothetical protein
VFIIVLGLVSNGVKFINIEDPTHMFFGYHGNSIIDGVRYRTEINETLVKDNISGSFNLKELKVTNNFGDIKVLPSEAKSIRVEAEVTVKCNDEGKAREYAKNAIEIKEGEVTELSLKNPSNWNKKDYSMAQIDFVIYVPKQVSVNAMGSFGDIDVEGIAGKCILENKNGEVEAKNIGGDVDIENSFGDIEVSDIGGKADITNKNGEISADRITGSAVIEGHFGDIEAIKIGGDLKIANNNGRISVSEVTGKADLSNAFGDINLGKVNNGVVVESKNGRIEAEEIVGNVQIKNSFGDIYLKSASINDGDIYAKTKFGDINCEKPLQLNKEGQDTIAQGKLGSGQYRIELITNNGDIDIE